MSLRFVIEAERRGTLCDNCGRFFSEENLEGRDCPSDDCPSNCYLIRSVAELDDDGKTPLYWSNHFGWVSKAQADSFTAAQKEQFYLPIGGEWEKEAD